MYTPTAVFKNQPKEAAPPAAGLLIDDVGVDAVVAFGLRKLRAAYTGDAIRVRRASDNAEQDIGFSGENLDASALTTFCTGTNGYIKTFYDQSGNSNDITQTTTGLQALVYDSSVGAIVNSQGNYACRTTEVGDTTSIGDYIYVSNTFSSANKTPTVCLVMEYIAYNGNGITTSEQQNGYSIGTYGGPNINAISIISSTGARIGNLGTITIGDTFAFYTFMNDDGGTNASTIIGSSDVGLANGGTKAANTVAYTAAVFNASTYDSITLFYCCGTGFYMNQYFSEYVFWDIATANTELSGTEQDNYFTNVNNYYNLQF